MFADSVLVTSRDQRMQRGWVTLTSFGLQAAILGSVLTISLLNTVGVPLARTVSTPITMGRRDPGPAPVGRARRFGIEIAQQTGRLMMPGRIPDRILPGDGPGQQTEVGLSGDEIGDIGLPIGQANAFPLPMSGTRPMMPLRATPSAPHFFTSRLLQGSLVHRVEPAYPPLARSARIQGPVVLEAFISKEGTMENLWLISGHPMLVPAAIDAVSKWRYKPYILNGEAIEVETQITVNFILAGN